MKNRAEFDAVVFDMDGVIFDSEKCVMECWKIIAERHHIPNIEQACHACLGVNAAKTREIMKGLYGADFPYDAYKNESNEIYWEKYGEGRLPLKPAIEELLKAIKANGKKIALASSTRQAVVKQELIDAKLIQYFDQVICGDMVKKSKPEPDIFLRACRELEVDPERAYVIEDSYNGIRAANRAGTHPIMVPDLAAPDAEMEELAEIILPDLSAVKNYLFPLSDRD